MIIKPRYLITLIMFGILVFFLYLDNDIVKNPASLFEGMRNRNKRRQSNGKKNSVGIPRTVWTGQSRGYKTIFPGDSKFRRKKYFRNNINYMYDNYNDYYGYHNVWQIPLFTPFFYPLTTYTCPKGCAMVGNNSIGCVNPTNEPNSCIFASDCLQC